MKLIHLNCRKNKELTLDIINEINTSSKTILSISEPNEKSLSENVNHINCFGRENQAIVTSPDINAIRIPTKNKSVMSIYLEEYKTLIIAVYLVSGANTEVKQHETRKRITVIKNLLRIYEDSAKVIMGDLNMTNVYWQRNVTTRQWKIQQATSDDFAATLIQRQIRPINDNWSTTFKTSGNVIDMIFISKEIKSESNELIDDKRTDHYGIKSKIKIERIAMPKKTKKQKIFGSWSLALMDMETVTSGKWNRENPLIKNCHEIVHFPDRHAIWKIPKKKQNKFHRLLKRKKEIIRNSKVNKEWEKDLEAINDQIKSKLGKIDLLRTLRTTKESKIIWRIIQKNLIGKQQRIDWSNPTTIESRDNWLKGFTTDRPQLVDEVTQVEGNLKEYEIEKICKMRFRTSSLTADNFTPRTWNKFFEKNKVMIIEVIQKIFTMSHVPNLLTIYGCDFVPKQNTYKIRMVQSPCFLMKIVDKILAERLLDIADEFLLKDTQFGFIRGGSREKYYYKIYRDKMYPKWSTVKIDVSTAFDSVDIDPIMSRLERHLDESTYQLLVTMNRNKWITYWDGKKKKYKKLESGVAQGTSTGPILFVFALDKVMRLLWKENLKIYAFADDLVMLVEEAKIGEAISMVEKGLITINLKINHSKTEILKKSEKMDGELIGFTLPFNSTVSISKFDRMMGKVYAEVSNSMTNENWPIMKYLPEKIKKMLVDQKLFPLLHKALPMMFGRNFPRVDKIMKILGSLVSLYLGKSRSRWSYWVIHNYTNPLTALITRNLLELPNVNKIKEIPIPKIDNKRKYGPTEEYISYEITGKNTMWITHEERERRKGYKFTFDKLEHDYDTKIVGLRQILNKWADKEITIMLEETTSKYLYGKSNFAKAIRMELNKPGKWRFTLFRKRERDQREISFLDSPVTVFQENQLQHIREMTKNAEELMEEYYNESDSPLRMFNLKMKNKLNYGQKMILDKITSYKFRIECCGKTNTMEHFLTECEWIQNNNTNLEMIMKKTPEKWTRNDVKTMNDIYETIEYYRYALYLLSQAVD